MKRNQLFANLVILFVVAGLLSCTRQEKTVDEVMDRVVSHLYESMDIGELPALDQEQVMSLFSEDELKTLATRHWTFEVNVPVVVSVMRSVKQKNQPFWLTQSGFVKTGMTMKNEQTTYEVWQKPFGAGTVGLGINGFENYGLHYFVSVAPQHPNDQLHMQNFYPKNQYTGILDDGAFIYHDWDELVLTDVPEEMKGQKLLTTIRGRGAESHLIGAFRTSSYPSSQTADQVMLTWSSDPATGVDIQWRMDTTVNAGLVVYREKGSNREYSVQAEKYRMEDRLLANDRFINRFTAKLRELKPGTTYEYRITPSDNWTGNHTFSTAAGDDRFSFVWFGDTHYSPTFEKLINTADQTYPDVAFYSIAGDLVSDGLHRNQWDELFEYSKNVIRRKPLMSVPGNHDNRYGLGARMYRNLFSYPENGPEGVEKEQTYSFEYKNALFLMIDATSPVEAQTSWIEEQLARSTAVWKFAMFHFPPYNWEEPYADIQKAWVPLFDKHHVDVVMGGHIHYYMRSKPMKAGQVVESYNEGTAYLISIALPTKNHPIAGEPYAAVTNTEGHLYQHVKIDGRSLSFSALNADNQLIDSFTIKK
ncbi:metallophosphoesterase [Gaoshiqia sp. Z1-71]|uniref:metallophosphoesterase n=1 Tax=Gaoshiqia hydrogeniformans TaxID=3290090 RepID=UPI003BF7FD22